MKRLPLFWRLFSAFGLLIVLTLTVFVLVGGAWMEQAVLHAVEERLRAESALLQDFAHAKDPETLQHRLRAIHQQLDSRVTLIAGDGRVVGDTVCDNLEDLDNHGHRPEIQSARFGALGTAKRYSTSTLQNMVYVARRVEDADSSVAFVRVALPVSVIDRDIRGAQSALWMAAVLAGGLALFLGWRLIGGITEPLEQLQRSAAEVAGGAYGQKVYLDRHDELGRLVQAFNSMSAALDNQFAELLHRRQQLRALLDSMAEGVVAVDADYNVSFVNERAAQLLSFSAEEATRCKLWEVVRHSAVHDLVDRVLAGENGRAESLDSLAFCNRTLAVHATRLQPGDLVRGAVLVFHDITDVRRLQRVRQDFVADLSHQLRTPLAVIAASVETLQDGAVDDLQNRDKFLDHIAVHTQRLSALVVDLLELARHDSGKVNASSLMLPSSATPTTTTGPN